MNDMRIQSARNPILVVSGSIHFDVVMQLPHLPVENDRIMPSAMTLAPGGMGGNVAAAFARLGGRSRFAGAFAEDADGEALRADLIRDGVDTRWAGTRPGREYRGFILVGADGARAIIGGWPQIVHLQRAPGQAPGSVYQVGRPPWNPSREQSAIDPGPFGDDPAGFYCPFNFGPLVLASVPEPVPVFMDLETGHVDGWDQASVRDGLDRATVLFANGRNMAHLAAMLDEPSPTALSNRLATILVETIGPDGCVIHHQGSWTAVPGHPVRAIDTTGAGDCFAAAFTLAFLRGNGPVESARFANLAAALSTRQLGSRAGVPTAAEISSQTRPPLASVAHRTLEAPVYR
jgi:ribokinase